MKSTFIFLFCLSAIPISSFANCNGEEGAYFINNRHRNPTIGGFVSSNAYVDDSNTADLFIGPNVSICESSNITGGSKIYGSVLCSGRAFLRHRRIDVNHLASSATNTNYETALEMARFKSLNDITYILSSAGAYR
ncbi:hypothetical protein A9Q84_13800 [Halobacteriovorax marinus]|uniref:Uncharacterized protein n=1 Tax=Halobacteriovorax marinus TaxID=97084 RepID=A0A1Y5F9C1_9BACT|nr:hypothetical protein A9Q84_13800 [Halobacteriovorax marinus]